MVSASARRSTLTRHLPTIAMLLSALVGLRFDLSYGLTAGGLAAFALSPVWFPWLLGNRWGVRLLTLALLAVASGVILTQLHAGHHTVLTNDLVARSIALLQLVACVGALLWACAISSVRHTVLAFAVGLAASIPFNVSSDPNLWRFTLSIPLGVLVLVLLSMRDSLPLTIGGIGVLALVGFVNDSRSNSVFLLLTAVIIVWQRIASRGSRRTRGWGGIVSVAVSGVLIALLIQSAILEGYFGEVTQQRTAAQIERGGSAIVGGRPEIAASAALIAKYPLGLGSGIRANYADIQAAKTGMADIGYDPNNGYVERFMFGSGIELHSVTGNLWVWFGLAGLALAVLIAVLLIVGVKNGYTGGVLTPIFVYLTLRAFWDLLFSPFASAMRLWPLVLVLAIVYAMGHISQSTASLRALEAPLGAAR